MGELETQYREALAQLPPPGDPQREPLKRALWDKYQGRAFLAGDSRGVRVIHRAQRKFATEYFGILAQFYGGELSDFQYQLARIAALMRYTRRLVRAELLTREVQAADMLVFLQESLQLERSLVPVPARRRGLTDQNADTLCNPLRDFSKQFFKQVHEQLGVGRLRDVAEIYGGVDAECTEQELQGRAPVSRAR